jgi:hypothetical protein
LSAAGSRHEKARPTNQNALNVSIDVGMVDRNQVQRALLTNSEEQFPFLLVLMGLIGLKPEPADKPGNRHSCYCAHG